MVSGGFESRPIRSTIAVETTPVTVVELWFDFDVYDLDYIVGAENDVSNKVRNKETFPM